MNDLKKIVKEARELGPVEQGFTCKYCALSFVKESTLAAHTCEPKRRIFQKDEIGVRLGFNAWVRFFELTQGSAASKTKTYDDFVTNRLYGAFVKFGRHLHSIRAINSSGFTDWVIKNNKKLDHWCKDEFYSEFLKEHIRRERAQEALERSIKEIGIWAEETNSPVESFFVTASPYKICMMITHGRISPWVIYCSDSGVKMLETLND